MFPIKLIASYLRASKIVKEFKPHVVIGTGGYASGPVMIAATRSRIPSLIQEQNSFAGLTNKQVAGKVNKVCVAYEGMEKYFPADKIVLTGNPVRKDILSINGKHEQALNHFGFSASKRTLLIIGGSLGARTINESVLKGIDKLVDADVQIIWQTGKSYYEACKARLAGYDLRQIRLVDFLKEMDLAYAAADVVISRSGAIAVSELCIAHKPSILVPSPNVAEDHQTKNAMALVDRQAALLVRDNEAQQQLVSEALKLLFDDQQISLLSKNIGELAKPNATNDIVNEIEKIIGISRDNKSSIKPLAVVMS